MAGVRAVVHAWWKEEALAVLSIAAQIKVALSLFEEQPTEDKLAGVLALSEILLPHLSKKHLPAFARLFAHGYIGRHASPSPIMPSMVTRFSLVCPLSFSRTLTRWFATRSALPRPVWGGCFGSFLLPTETRWSHLPKSMPGVCPARR